MEPEKYVICKGSFGIAPAIRGRGAEVIDDIVVEIVGFIRVSAFVDDPR